MSNSGIVNIRGKEYQTVALRVQKFREAFGQDWSITAEIISIDEERVVIKATISDPLGYPKATGFAEESRASSQINRTSALENCETSAIGRALAAMGLGGSEYATANEVQNAIHQQDEDATHRKKLEEAKQALADSITAIKDALNEGNMSTAAEAWFELSDDEKQSIWVAPTKGGPFTTKEREIMKTPQFREAYYGPDKETA